MICTVYYHVTIKIHRIIILRYTTNNFDCSPYYFISICYNKYWKLVYWPVDIALKCLRSLQVLDTGVDGSATLQLRMIRFDNPKRKLANGKSCDTFGSHCDSIFQFSLDRGDRWDRHICCSITHVEKYKDSRLSLPHWTKNGQERIAHVTLKYFEYNEKLDKIGTDITSDRYKIV